MIGKIIVRIFSAYAPQSGLPDQEKDNFYNNLLGLLSNIPDDEFLIVCGDFNGHVDKISSGFDDICGGNGVEMLMASDS